MIPDYLVEQVRAASDVAQLVGETVRLRRSGRSFKGLCPFHAERTPSFHVRPDKGYKCFGCGESGDVFTWVMKQQGIGFLDAVRVLAGRAGITIPGDDGEAVEFDPRAHREAMKAHRAALRERERREQQERWNATLRAREFWDTCDELRNGHPYLERKGLDMRGAHGLRVDRDGWLVVPAWDSHGEILSYQRISPDGVKLYAEKAPMRGATYVLERFQPVLQVVCEGLATGLAIYAAVPNSRVTIAFSTGGLADAVSRLPAGFCVIAADNDHRTLCQRHKDEGLGAPMDPRAERPEWCRCNPGVTAALAAAASIGLPASAVAEPTCPDGGTDWQDWRAETLAAELEAWMRKPHETEAVLRRRVDHRLAMHMQKAAHWRAP